MLGKNGILRIQWNVVPLKEQDQFEQLLLDDFVLFAKTLILFLRFIETF